MSEPFLGEIRVFSFNFPPKGWALCNGQAMPINQNQALFSLLGTTYGGNGQTTFALPDLRARSPMHMGNGHILGERGGETTHTLSAGELPSHTHLVQASTAPGRYTQGTGHAFASARGHYADATALVSMAPATGGTTGGSQPHDNMPPYLVLNFGIALQGIFPSRN